MLALPESMMEIVDSLMLLEEPVETQNDALNERIGIFSEFSDELKP